MTEKTFNLDDPLVWDCESWMFPTTISSRFPLPQSQATDPTHISKNQNFSGSALIIANRPLPSHTAAIWANTSTKLCADGGADRLFAWATMLQQQDKYLPNYVIGDMDSVSTGVKSYYANLNTTVIDQRDQDTTDFEKTVRYFAAMGGEKPCVIVIGALGGNFSQELANFHSCWNFPSIQFAFLGESNLILHLPAGRHVIRAMKGLKCGIIPLGSKCESTTTTGLKWNLNQQALEFGHLISSSNVTVDDQVQITNSHPLVWTFDFATEV